MSITVVLRDEAAHIVERHVADGRYPDAESAVAAALLLLDEAAKVNVLRVIHGARDLPRLLKPNP